LLKLLRRKKNWPYTCIITAIRLGICKEVHLSPSTLSSIIKSEAGYIENLENKLDYKSKETRALALYDKKKVPLEVSVELDIPADKAVEFYEKFQRLKSIPLEDRQIKLTHEIKQLESEKSRTNSQLIDLRNLVIESNRMLEFYKTCIAEWNSRITGSVGTMWSFTLVQL
jgi:hypothetical protein